MDGEGRPKVTENEFNTLAEGLRKLVEKINAQRQRNTELAAAREAATQDLLSFLDELNKDELKRK